MFGPRASARRSLSFAMESARPADRPAGRFLTHGAQSHERNVDLRPRNALNDSDFTSGRLRMPGRSRSCPRRSRRHCRRAVTKSGLGHQGLAGVRVRPLHRDRPLGLEVGNEAREVPQPPVGSAGRSGVGHHIGDAQRHFPRFAHATPDPRASRPPLTHPTPASPASGQLAKTTGMLSS